MILNFHRFMALMLTVGLLTGPATSVGFTQSLPPAFLPAGHSSVDSWHIRLNQEALMLASCEVIQPLVKQGRVWTIRNRPWFPQTWRLRMARKALRDLGVTVSDMANFHDLLKLALQRDQELSPGGRLSLILLKNGIYGGPAIEGDLQRALAGKERWIAGAARPVTPAMLIERWGAAIIRNWSEIWNDLPEWAEGRRLLEEGNLRFSEWLQQIDLRTQKRLLDAAAIGPEAIAKARRHREGYLSLEVMWRTHISQTAKPYLLWRDVSREKILDSFLADPTLLADMLSMLQDPHRPEQDFIKKLVVGGWDDPHAGSLRRIHRERLKSGEPPFMGVMEQLKNRGAPEKAVFSAATGIHTPGSGDELDTEIRLLSAEDAETFACQAIDWLRQSQNFVRPFPVAEKLRWLKDHVSRGWSALKKNAFTIFVLRGIMNLDYPASPRNPAIEQRLDGLMTKLDRRFKDDKSTRSDWNSHQKHLRHALRSILMIDPTEKDILLVGSQVPFLEDALHELGAKTVMVRKTLQELSDPELKDDSFDIVLCLSLYGDNERSGYSTVSDNLTRLIRRHGILYVSDRLIKKLSGLETLITAEEFLPILTDVDRFAAGGFSFPENKAFRSVKPLAAAPEPIADPQKAENVMPAPPEPHAIPAARMVARGLTLGAFFAAGAFVIRDWFKSKSSRSSSTPLAESILPTRILKTAL
jgi:hypothetical protein